MASILIAIAMAVVLAYATQYLGTKVSILAGLIACALPSLGFVAMTRWNRVQYPGLVAMVAWIATAVGAYGYCVVRAAIMLEWLMFPILPSDLLKAIQFLTRHMVSVDLITGESQPIKPEIIKLFFVLHSVILACVLFFNPLTAYLAMRARPPYCHRCRRWMRQPICRLYAKRPHGIVRWSYEIERGRLETLDALEPTDDTSHALRLDVLGCPACSDVRFLDVWDQHGQGSEQVKHRIVHSLILTKEHVASLIVRLGSTHTDDASPIDA